MQGLLDEADSIIEEPEPGTVRDAGIIKECVWLDIRMTPYFPTKSFVIKLDGHKGDDGNEWDAEYQQE